jgi:pSer/pThr/pTyr-binding forkhead associated (FHA) protein
MNVKLQVLHGKLQNSRGKNAGPVVRVRGAQFVIGSDADCSMCCRSTSVSPHHCEIRLDGQQIIVRDLYSRSGTFVNDERVDHERLLRAGDRLRIGRLEFTVVVEQTTAPDREAVPQTRTRPDVVADFVSQFLVEEDEKERARRMEDPASRQFALERSKPPAAPPAPQDAAAALKKARPAKKPPAKLPAPPPFSASSTGEAAEETLKKIFFKGKR